MVQSRAASVLLRVPVAAWLVALGLIALAVALVVGAGEYRRHRVLMELELLGYDTEGRHLSKTSWLPTWLAERLPPETVRTWCFRVHALRLPGGDTADLMAERAALRAFPEVTDVVFDRATTLDDFESLRSVANLQRLELQRQKGAAQRLEGFGMLTGVRSLRLDGIFVTAAGLREVARCRGLESLSLRGNLNREVLHEAGRLARIRSLILHPVNPGRGDPPPFLAHHVAELRGLSACQELNLGIVDFGALGALPDLPALTTLRVAGNVKLEELARLTSRRTLTSVNIASRRLYDRCREANQSGALSGVTETATESLKFDLNGDHGNAIHVIVTRAVIPE